MRYELANYYVPLHVSLCLVTVASPGYWVPSMSGRIAGDELFSVRTETLPGDLRLEANLTFYVGKEHLGFSLRFVEWFERSSDLTDIHVYILNDVHTSDKSNLMRTLWMTWMKTGEQSTFQNRNGWITRCMNIDVCVCLCVWEGGTKKTPFGAQFNSTQLNWIQLNQIECVQFN